MLLKCIQRNRRIRDINDIPPKFCARHSLFRRIGFNEIYCHLPDIVDGRRAIAANTLISEARGYMQIITEYSELRCIFMRSTTEV